MAFGFDFKMPNIDFGRAVAQPEVNKPIAFATKLNPNIAKSVSFARQPDGATGAQGPTPAPAAPPPAQVPQQPVTAQQAASQQPAMQQQMQSPVLRRQLGMPTGYYQQPMQMPQQPAQSVTQQASRGNAQSISNYLTALRQAGAGTNNAMMNAPGQLGAGPQAGFMGFGQNGIQTQLGGRFVGPNQMQTGLSFQNNMASAGPNYFAGNQAYSPGLQQARDPRLTNTGGISTVNGPGLLAGAQNAPQYQQPQPWLNQKNMPANSQEWEDYFYGKYDPNMNPKQQAQPGSMYNPNFERPPDPNAPPPTQAEIDASNAQLQKTVEENQASYPWEFWNWSDERLKENITPAQNELEDFMKNLGVYSYEYKDKKHGEGRYISPMAQEFEKSKLGKEAVVTDPESGYKMVNYGRLIGVQTAALALVNNKLNKLEDQFKKSITANLKTKRGK